MLSSVRSGDGNFFSVFGSENVPRLFSCSLGLLATALGLNEGFYPAFCVCAGTAGFLLYQDISQRPKDLSWRSASHAELWSTLYLPICLFLYTALTPGHFLKDLPIACKMFAAWLIGLAAARLSKPLLAASLLPLPLVLAVSIAVSPFFGYSWEERLCLGFSHPNVLGAIAAWSVLLVLALRDAYPARLRPLAFGAAAFCACGVVLASSRAALLGLAIGSLFFLRHGLRKHFLTFLSVGLICITMAAFILPDRHVTRLETALRTPIADVTFQSRLPIWEAAWNGFLQAPVWGNGVRTFESWHNNYVAQYKDNLRQRYDIVETRIGNPHHFILGLLYMYGLIGLTLFAATFIPTTLRAWRNKDDLLLGILLFFLVQGLFEFTLHRKDGIFMLFFPLGLIGGQLLNRVGKEDGKKVII